MLTLMEKSGYQKGTLMDKIKKWISKLTESFKLSGIPVIIGILGAYSGSEGTSLLWRRCGIPLIFTICALIELKSLWVILLMSIWGWLSLGYGIPDDNYPVSGDSGSDVGRFWTMLFRKHTTIAKAHRLGDYFTRGTISLLISISFLVIPILKGNWFFYLLGSIGIISVYVFNSWRGYGQFIVKWKDKTYYLLKVDFVTYSILGICGLFIIMKG